MESALAINQLHFAFTVTFRYILPQLTMGLALLLVVLKTMALSTGNDHYNYNQAARFWAKIFAINFAMSVEMRGLLRITPCVVPGGEGTVRKLATRIDDNGALHFSSNRLALPRLTSNSIATSYLSPLFPGSSLIKSAAADSVSHTVARIPKPRRITAPAQPFHFQSRISGMSSPC